MLLLDLPLLSAFWNETVREKEKKKRKRKKKKKEKKKKKKKKKKLKGKLMSIPITFHARHFFLRCKSSK